jgi:hypothetical protein
MTMEKYARFDEIDNVLASLEMMVVLAAELRKKRRGTLWKWMVIGAHDALQGAIVCAVADSTGTNVLNKVSAKEMLQFLRGEAAGYPRKFMAKFNVLLRHAKIKMSDVEKKCIRQLPRMRNDFVHFTPKSWSIEIGYMAKSVAAGLHAVEELMGRDAVKYRMTGNKKRRLASSIHTVVAAISNLNG